MATLSEAAKLLSCSLETASRSDGSPFLRLSSSAPDWGSSVIREAHSGELPNDSRYELISDCLSALADGSFSDEEEAGDALRELSLDLMPSYTAELLQWFANRASRLECCDEALAEGRVSGGRDLTTYEILSEGWRVDCEQTLSSLISSLEEERLSIFNPDTDCQLLLSDSHGVYIPQMYCSDITEDDCEDLSIRWEDVRLCQSGPDEELYWEAWQSILDSAEYEEGGHMWRLLQNGDLWAVKADAVIPEAWF